MTAAVTKALSSAPLPVRIGTAGWSVHARYGAEFPSDGSHLQRYGSVLNAVEINSSFYRAHKRSTYERWAASVPEGFQFAVKVPKAITHEARLIGAEALLADFIAGLSGLSDKQGPLLVQLPPKLSFNVEVAKGFFSTLRDCHAGHVACEPRHVSWFTDEAEALLEGYRVARVAADPPAGSPAASEPGGWRGLAYYRLHGSPRVYYSDYDSGQLAEVAGELRQRVRAGAEAWCILDNTAAFEALGDALEIQRLTGGV